jgi:hypothetical protein
LLVLAALCSPLPAAQDEPLAVVEASNVDLGQVVRGEKRLAEFVVHNRGNAPLKITEVKPGCGCTVASFDETVPVGGTGRIKATVDTTTLSGFVGRGLTAFTNDPLTPELFLTFHANVVGSVVVFPEEELRLTNTVRGERRGHLLVRQDPTEEGELVIGDVRPSVPGLDVRVERLEAPREIEGLTPGKAGDWLIEVSLRPSAAAGQGDQSISFSTGLPRQPEVTVPVRLVVRPPVNLSTEEVTLAPGEPATVLATVRRGLDADALQVASEPEGLRVAVERTGSRHFRISLTYEGPPDRSDGVVRFSVGDERHSLRVRLPGS